MLHKLINVHKFGSTMDDAARVDRVLLVSSRDTSAEQTMAQDTGTETAKTQDEINGYKVNLEDSMSAVGDSDSLLGTMIPALSHRARGHSIGSQIEESSVVTTNRYDQLRAVLHIDSTKHSFYGTPEREESPTEVLSPEISDLTAALFTGASHSMTVDADGAEEQKMPVESAQETLNDAISRKLRIIRAQGRYETRLEERGIRSGSAPQLTGRRLFVASSAITSGAIAQDEYSMTSSAQFPAAAQPPGAEWGHSGLSRLSSATTSPERVSVSARVQGTGQVSAAHSSTGARALLETEAGGEHTSTLGPGETPSGHSRSPSAAAVRARPNWFPAPVQAVQEEHTTATEPEPASTGVSATADVAVVTPAPTPAPAPAPPPPVATAAVPASPCTAQDRPSERKEEETLVWPQLPQCQATLTSSTLPVVAGRVEATVVWTSPPRSRAASRRSGDKAPQSDVEAHSETSSLSGATSHSLPSISRRRAIYGDRLRRKGGRGQAVGAVRVVRKERSHVPQRKREESTPERTERGPDRTRRPMPCLTEDTPREVSTFCALAARGPDTTVATSGAEAVRAPALPSLTALAPTSSPINNAPSAICEATTRSPAVSQRKEKVSPAAASGVVVVVAVLLLAAVLQAPTRSANRPNEPLLAPRASPPIALNPLPPTISTYPQPPQPVREPRFYEIDNDLHASTMGTLSMRVRIEGGRGPQTRPSQPFAAGGAVTRSRGRRWAGLLEAINRLRVIAERVAQLVTLPLRGVWAGLQLGIGRPPDSARSNN